MTPVRLEPATLRSRVKHSTTEPLRSQEGEVRIRIQGAVSDMYAVDACYRKFRNFRENFIFANSVKRHICQVKNSRLWHALPTSVMGKDFLPFRESFVFLKLRMRKVS